MAKNPVSKRKKRCRRSCRKIDNFCSKKIASRTRTRAVYLLFKDIYLFRGAYSPVAMRGKIAKGNFYCGKGNFYCGKGNFYCGLNNKGNNIDNSYTLDYASKIKG